MTSRNFGLLLRFLLLRTFYCRHKILDPSPPMTVTSFMYDPQYSCAIVELGMILPMAPFMHKPRGSEFMLCPRGLVKLTPDNKKGSHRRSTLSFLIQFFSISFSSVYIDACSTILVERSFATHTHTHKHNNSMSFFSLFPT